jgi:tetratricopeptide (TPR) repeat protein
LVPETIDALVDLSHSAKKFSQAADLMTEALEGETDSVRRVGFYSRLGDTQRVHLELLDESLASYQAALELDPQGISAQNGLSELLKSENLAHLVVETLAEAHTRSGNLSAIIELLETRLNASPASEFSAKVLKEAAGIHESEGEIGRALAALGRAFALSTSSENEADLLRLGELAADFQTVSSAYEAAILAQSDDAQKFPLYVARGHLEERRLQRFVEASQAYLSALRIDPSDHEVGKSLVRTALSAGATDDAAWGFVELCREGEAVGHALTEYFAERASLSGDWSGVLVSLAKAIASAKDLPAVVTHDLKVQLASWYRDEAHDLDAAELILVRAVQDFSRQDSLSMLADLQRRAPGRPLVSTLTVLSDLSGDDLLLLREAGTVALESVRDGTLATPLLEKALRVSSERFAAEEAGGSGAFAESRVVAAWATDRLVDLATAEERFEDAVDILEASAQLPFDDQEKSTRRYRAAKVAASAGLDDRAAVLCERILSVARHHEGAITLLSSLHEKAGRLDELLELRKRELDLDRPQERRLFLRLDQSRVLGQTGADLKDRVEILRANLMDLPGHAETISALSAIHTAEEAYEELAEMLESQAKAIVDREPERAARLWESAGRLVDEHFNDLERLFNDYRLSATAAPSIHVVDRLAGISGAQEAWESEVSWLQLRLSLTPSKDESEVSSEDRRQVVLRLATALVRSDERQAARDCLRDELSNDPGADELRQLLAKTYKDLGEWEALSRLLAAGVEFVETTAARVSYLRRAAVVERRRLGNLGGAIPLLESAILLDSSDRSLKLLLADTLRAAERFDAAAQLLHELLADFGRRRTKEKATVHTQLARIAQATGNLDEALEQAEAAAKIERTDPGILMLVGQLAVQKGQLERAEQAYQTLALIASRRTGSDSDDDFEEVGESTILFELYRIAEEKGDVIKSRELLDSALEAATRRPDEAIRLAGALLKIDRVDLLLSALSDRLESGLEGELAARLLVTKANVLEQAQREEEAYAARKLALTQAPQDVLLLDTTQKLAERVGLRAEFWEHVIRLAETNADNPLVAGELWYRVGLAAEAEGENLGRAAEFFELAQKTGHKPKRSFLALDRVLDEGAEPERVCAALVRFVSAPGVESSPDTLGDALYRLANFEIAAGRISQGAEHLLLALEADAQEDRALSMLEPAMRQGDAPAAVVLLFLRVCRKAADQRTLLFAYQEAAKTDDVNLNLLSEGVELARSLANEDALRELLSRSIGVGVERDELPMIRGLLVERASLARADQEFQLEASLLEKSIACFEAEERFDLELRWAECLTDDLNDVAAGRAIFERLLNAEPEDSRVWRPLLALYRDAGLTGAVEALIAQVESHVTDEADLEALKMERVRLMVREERIEEAEAELRRALEERPHLAEAASILAELLRKAERWVELRELVEALYNRARERKDAKLVVRFGLELAKLVDESDRSEAISVLNAGLSLAKESQEYLSYLSSLYGADDNQSELSDVMEMLLALQRGVDARNLAFELYNLRNSIGDEYGAERALEIAVGLAPEQDDLVQFYVDFLRASEEHEKLALALMLQGERLGKGAGAAAKFGEAAGLFDEQLSDPGRAAEAISKAYGSDPTNTLYLERGAQYLVSLGRIDEALEKLNVAIDVGEEATLADLLELRANIYRRDRASDRAAMTQAAADLGRALEQLIPEEQEDSLQSLRVEILVGLRTLHQVASDAASERKVVLELASVLDETGDRAGGIDTLASWLREHETDTDVATQLGATATKAGDNSTAVFAYGKLVQATDGPLRTNAVLLLADAAEAAGSPLDARVALEEAFGAEPSDVRLRDRLRSMYEAGGQFEELAAILTAEADKSEDADVRSALFIDIGDLYMKAESGEAACSAYEQALEITEEPYRITAKLAQAYVGMGEVKRAEEILTEAVRAHGKRRSPELALLQGTLANVAQAMGNDDGMFAWLEAALMSDRNNADIASELAVKAQDQGRYEIAIKALQSLTLSKTSGSISKAEAYFRQAQIAQAQGDEKKALLMARRAHSTETDLPGVDEFLAALGG